MTESESEESESFHFLPTPLTTLLLMFRLWSSENQIVGVGVGSRSGRISQSEYTFPCFVIGLVLLLLLLTLTMIWFSLGHKQNVSDGVISGIGVLFSLRWSIFAHLLLHPSLSPMAYHRVPYGHHFCFVFISVIFLLLHKYAISSPTYTTLRSSYPFQSRMPSLQNVFLNKIYDERLPGAVKINY